jgi:hypothetical protein
MKKGIRLLFSIGITLLCGFVMFYLFLPALNIHSVGFWMYVIVLLLIFGILNFGTGLFSLKKKEFDLRNRRNYYPFILPVIIIVLMFIIHLINGPFFMAKKYANRISIANGNFTEEIEEVNFNTLAIVDKNSSQKLGDRVMGSMGEMVSQFEVSNLYTQINYQDEIVRVTPLDYYDWIKYFTNRSDGIPGYVMVNSVTGEAKLVKLEKGMKYSPNAMFFENIYRKLRFKYPFDVFGDLSFEIDNEGTPYWIMQVVSYSGIEQREDISGVIILNAITGESKKYSVSEVPTWVDHVYSPELIIEQVDDWGRYVNGFWNTLFGQKGMKMTTDGYNYIAMSNDIYMYTGITSVVSDESNLGFILTNLRTKETKYFDCPGAEEYSAMDSARGQVQQMNYTASFPILINLSGRPTYVISLKDDAELVKMYAFVDVADYQKVVVTDAASGIQNAAYNYINNNGIVTKGKEIEITVSTIKDAIIDGNTYYYITDTNGKKYRASIKINSNKLPFIKSGDKVTVAYNEKEVREIINVK